MGAKVVWGGSSFSMDGIVWFYLHEAVAWVHDTWIYNTPTEKGTRGMCEWWKEAAV